MIKSSRLHDLAEIGIALSAEENIDKLLEMIVNGARKLTGADAGTLYIVDEERHHLRFEILQNDTLKIRMGGTSGVEITFPPVPLEILGKPNHANVSSYVALRGEIVNIADIYQAEGFDFSGSRTYDAATGYHSQSILVIPLKNYQDQIIGVLQLLNAKAPNSGEVISFESELVDLVASLASQAAVVLTNRQLIRDSRDSSNLFEAFLKSIASAIDEKSPYTGGHIRRVTELTMMVAERVNASTEGPFAHVHFDDNDLEELYTAAWMHDIGKIVLPEHVVCKRTKLETVFDRIQLLNTRFQLIRQAKENQYLKRRLEQLESGKTEGSVLKKMDQEFQKEIKTLQEEEEFLVSCNTPRENMGEEEVERLKEIAHKTYQLDGTQNRYLTDEELHNLSIRKGSLTPEEMEIIRNHAAVSIRMLNDLPFPKRLSRVAEYAGAHHEKLDGSGYPLGLSAEQLSIQARIIAIADIFESLTARDRPYREPTELSEVLEILREMKENQHIDPDLYDLFLETNLFEEYIERTLGITRA